MRRSTPSRSPTSSTWSSSATARRRSSRCRAWSGRSRPSTPATGRPRTATVCGGAARAAGRQRAVYVPSFYDVEYLPDGRIGRVVPEQRRGAVAGRQAHPHGPRRVAVSEDAAGPAGRDGARADERGDLPGLHPRLPLLPGRDDHPPGARALHRGPRRDDRERLAQDRLRGGRAALPEQRRPLRDRRAAPRAWPIGTRASRSRCRCRAPASTRSTSTWPTSSPATAVAPG